MSRKKCVHGRQAYYCKECKGGGICVHNRNRHYCKDCTGSQICKHKLVRGSCAKCRGSGICEHEKQRSGCKECNGCIHGRLGRLCCLCNPAGTYARYIRSEKKRWGSLPVGFMAFETYAELIKLPCTWCGRSPEQANGMGVDRDDNALGHIDGNLSPSCSDCNMVRGSWTRERFSAYLDVVRTTYT